MSSYSIPGRCGAAKGADFALSDAIYGGATITAAQEGRAYDLESIPKAYRRQLSHDGIYAAARTQASSFSFRENTDIRRRISRAISSSST